MAVQIERIAMILTALRQNNPGFNPGSINKVIISSDEDYQTAQLKGAPDPVLGKKKICQFGNFIRAVLIHEG